MRNVDTTPVPNVETTLHNVQTTLLNVGTTLMQRCFNLASTLVKAILNPIGLVMIVDCEIVEYMLNLEIVFILLNEKTFSQLYINHSTTDEIPKNFLIVVHILIHNVEAVVQRCSIKKVFLARMFYKTNLKPEKKACST